jgi:RNA-splicing ligase RtcB
MITGDTLIEWGFRPGSYFKAALEAANNMRKAGHDDQAIVEMVMTHVPPEPVYVPRQAAGACPIYYNIDVDWNNPLERENFERVKDHVLELSTLPTVRAIAVMPDACPSGKELGTIPVGGVAVTEGTIHPGMHSNDICCSVAISVFEPTVDPKALLDSGMKITHFGAGGRPYSNDMQVSNDLLGQFEGNKFLKMITTMAQKHFATQGDGNHFFYVGLLESTGQIALVTHHGSRGPGAQLYKLGIEAAWEHTQKVCPEVGKLNSWLDYDSADGEEYWQALQIIRQWTKKNHFAIHDAVAKDLGLKMKDRYWNEHNFVFKRDNFFYHAKGATPNYMGFSSDWTSKTLIPLNMAAPILICEVHPDPMHGMELSHNSLGFSPHGAGRNYSRTAFGKLLGTEGFKTGKQMIEEVTSKYDIRAFSGKHDISEFPYAYKDPQTIIDAIEEYDLTKVVDKVLPVGSIMAGHSGWSRR